MPSFLIKSLQCIEIILVLHNVSADAEKVIYGSDHTDHSAKDKVVQKSNYRAEHGGICLYQSNAEVEYILAPFEPLDSGNNVQYTDYNGKWAEKAQNLENTDYNPDNAVDLDSFG